MQVEREFEAGNPGPPQVIRIDEQDSSEDDNSNALGLCESDSEDEGKVDNVDILLKPEELLTTRSLKPKTKKTMRRNLDDPELQNLFLELESLQSSP